MNLQTKGTNTKTVILYFQIHQPRRLRQFSYFDIGSAVPYFDDDLDRRIIQRIAENCYLPANTLLLHLIQSHPEIRISFSVSGIAIEQLKQYAPNVIKSFQALIDTGSVEILCETSHHSLASQFNGNEFEFQIARQREIIMEVWGVMPSVFRNTELIYSNDIGDRVASMGFRGILTDGIESVLEGRSSYKVYQRRDKLKILLRSNSLSDDIGFRFQQGPSTLSVSQYLSWLETIPEDENVIVLGLDYETFGEHKRKDTGILEFLKDLIEAMWLHPMFCFKTPSELLDEVENAVKGEQISLDNLDVPVAISWADEAKDISAWLGNNLQKEAFAMVQKAGIDIHETEDPELLNTWRCLQTSDHFYYMATKNFADGSVHSYFSPYASPYEAFINYMNVVSDFEIAVNKKKEERRAAATDPSVIVEREKRSSAEPLWVEQLKEEYNLTHISN